MQYRRIPLINPGLIQLRKGFLSGSITGWAYNRGAGLLTEIELRKVQEQLTNRWAYNRMGLYPGGLISSGLITGKVISVNKQMGL